MASLQPMAFQNFYDSHPYMCVVRLQWRFNSNWVEWCVVRASVVWEIFSPTPITLWWKLLCWGSSEIFSWTWNWFRGSFVCGLFSLASLILFTLSSLILVLRSLVGSFLRWHTWHHLSGSHKNLWPMFLMLTHPSFCVILRYLYGRSERKHWNLQSHPVVHGIIPL